MASESLSELPDDIIRRIICNHLICDPSTSKTAIRLSLISKEFLSAVQRRPVLGFDLTKFDDPIRFTQELQHMISTLTRYEEESIHLDTFEITCPNRVLSFPDTTSLLPQRFLVDRCIKLAAAKNLSLRNLSLSMDFKYDLPKAFFGAESLVQLTLGSCSLQPDVGSIIMWPNLKSLSLGRVTMEEGVFEDLIKGCPVMECLKINRPIMGLASRFTFKVSNHGRLKKLDVRMTNVNQTLELGSLPNLESLICYYGNVVNLGEHEYHKLKRIRLSNLGASFNGDFLSNLAHRFPVLEELTLSNIKLNAQETIHEWHEET